MKGDFSRLTFNSKKHFSKVMMQQGRVQLDADWNEQVAMQTQFLRTLARDIIGDHGGPADACGFKIIGTQTQVDKNWPSEAKKEEHKSFTKLLTDKIILIGPGHYYVDGILCENEQWLGYNDQPDYPLDSPCNEECKGINTCGTISDIEDLKDHLLYLDVWERHISCVEDPELLEAALVGPDTTSRSRIVWQVKIHEIDKDTYDPSFPCESIKQIKNQCPEPRLKVRTDIPKKTEKGPCLIKPDARYLGLENQLYRIEIHKPGTAKDATFKWSKDNGSVIFPIISGTISINEGKTVVSLEHIGKDDRFTLKEGCYVELVHDDYVLLNRADPLMKVEKVDKKTMQATLIGVPVISSPDTNSAFKHPYLRLWNQTDAGKKGTALVQGAVQVLEGAGKLNWLSLENGIQIQFQKSTKKDDKGKLIENYYKTGDYWLIPARVSTGDVEWPKVGAEPEARPAFGIKHHYAPLAVITSDESGEAETLNVTDCRNCIQQAGLCPDT
jgi:hypothetical protein